MATQFDKFIATMKKVLMLDQADLDFGIYRIMNQKRDQIESYLNNDLRRQVTEAIRENASSDAEALKKELTQLVATLTAAGMNPDDAPKVKELKDRIAQCGNSEELENEVYSHLTIFFVRYYDGGDFISQRRYKKDVYAIPYEGEEVKLYWANADQYYIKTAEYFRNYRFAVDGDKFCEFTLREATTEQNNNVAQNNMERRFALCEETPVEVVGNTLHIYFTYELYPKATKQKGLIEAAYEAIKEAIPAEFAAVFAPRPTESDRTRTLLQKHLNDYVARNTFDYFIHKDLGGFLSRELDFYIKNEILVIDDINARTPDEFLKHLTVIKAIEGVGMKLITFLASLENYQKRLWLKKKFVVESNYCITLDRVPEKFYAEIAANDAQREEWVRLFAIDEITSQATNGLFEEGKSGYSVPLTVEFLKENPFLVLDTKFFTAEFKNALLASIDRIDEQCDGLLINSENFQALELLQEKYKGIIDCVYIDPPFNLNSGADYQYATNYKDSTWLTILDNRIVLSRGLLSDKASYFLRCDYHGNHFSRVVLDNAGLEYKSEILLKRSRNEAGSTKMDVTHEYLYAYTQPGVELDKYKLERSVADIKWTGFLMAGERNPPQREFLGKIIYPPAGQHFSLVQSKVDKLLSEHHLRLKCKKCGALYFKSRSSEQLQKEMKKKTSKFKFYDIVSTTLFHGVEHLDNCLDCGNSEFVVQYLGAPEEFVNDNWLDISSYSRRWGFLTENSEECLERVIRFTEPGSIILDFFMGSGTTVATSQKMGRKWIGIDMGEYFTTVALPRIKHVIAGENSGIGSCDKGGIFKYMRLEQYEDTLNNLTIQPATISKDNADFYDGYVLGYMLDIETRDSLFNMKWFRNPWNMKLRITRQNETREEKIDVIETFNYLIGLNVVSILYPKNGICTVEGVTRSGERTLVIWRDCDTVDNEALDDFFRRMSYSTRDTEFDRIYVNGDNNLENLRTDGEQWKVVLTEQEFAKRMFEDC